MIRRFMLAVAAIVVAVPVVQTGAGADGPGVIQARVSFRVENANRSRVPCMANGGTYTVAGWLAIPSSTLAADPGRRAVTLYLHGPDGDVFHFQAVPGYDFATEMAGLGHATVTIDRLGYGQSSTPNGLGTCLGSQADMVPVS